MVPVVERTIPDAGPALASERVANSIVKDIDTTNRTRFMRRTMLSFFNGAPLVKRLVRLASRGRRQASSHGAGCRPGYVELPRPADSWDRRAASRPFRAR